MIPFPASIYLSGPLSLSYFTLTLFNFLPSFPPFCAPLRLSSFSHFFHHHPLPSPFIHPCNCINSSIIHHLSSIVQRCKFLDIHVYCISSSSSYNTLHVVNTLLHKGFQSPYLSRYSSVSLSYQCLNPDTISSAISYHIHQLSYQCQLGNKLLSNQCQCQTNGHDQMSMYTRTQAPN